MGVKISELPETTELHEGCCMPIVNNGETKKVTYGQLKEQLEQDLNIPVEIDVDGALSVNSTNPVQNKVVTTALNNLGLNVNQVGLDVEVAINTAESAKEVAETAAETANKKVNVVQGIENANKLVVTDENGNISFVEKGYEVLDEIIIEEECVGALTFSNIAEYTEKYTDVAILGFMPYTETNTTAGNICVKGDNLDNNLGSISHGEIFFQKTGKQTTNRQSRLYFVMTKLFLKPNSTNTIYMGQGIISDSTAISAYSNTYMSGTFPSGDVSGATNKTINYLTVFQAQTWAVGTAFYLLGRK